MPSGDDGVQSVSEGLALGRDAFEHGTRVLYATPHVGPHVPPFDEARERRIRTAFRELRERLPLELRLGFELTPDPPLLCEDLSRYALEATDAVLIEVPFAGPVDLLLALLERIEEQGLTPVVAHPERAAAVQDDPSLLDWIAAPGRLLQVNATSLLGRHGDVALELGWKLVETGRAALVASDGHRPLRPARLDEAFALAVERVGEEAAALFDGSALGAEPRPSRPPAPSRAGSPAA